jgi:SAM-dependent methyltransferase
VVELAAGTGALTRLLAPRVLATSGTYLAVDISVEMLRQARATLDPRVELVVADAEATTLGASSADLVVSSLGVLQDSDEGWHEASRLLRHRGRVVLTMWGVDYAERDLIAEARRLLGGPALPGTPLADALARGSRAGFYSLRHEDVRLPVVHDSMQDYLQYRAAFGVPPWVPSGREAEAIDVITAAAGAYLNADGRVVLDWNVTVLDATVT